jgi:guanosine-3',5'-bis(diphosphate) 3'-pyrophosphohydrolase
MDSIEELMLGQSDNSPFFSIHDVSLLMQALRFSSEKHKNQRRKDAQALPYINHPIQVAETLWRIGKVRDMVTIVAALLHDTVEDTDTTLEEVRNVFGDEVALVVDEVSDNTSLPALERKRLQVEHSAHISSRAKQLKLADKICNIDDIAQQAPPLGWSLARKVAYLDWSEEVVEQLRGCNADLEQYYDALLVTGRRILSQE